MGRFTTMSTRLLKVRLCRKRCQIYLTGNADPMKHGLQPGWKPKMVSVKVVWVRLALPLVGPVLERKAIASSQDLYHRLHRRAYCWYHGDNGWGKIKSIDEVRALEKRVMATKVRAKL